VIRQLKLAVAGSPFYDPTTEAGGGKTRGILTSPHQRDLFVAAAVAPLLALALALVPRARRRRLPS